jgi:D-alanyl-D-alanine carboxypeptidase
MRLGHALRAGLLACAALVVGVMTPANPAQAQIGSSRYAAIVLEARSGNVLMAANADETRHPASLTKMMTLYMVFDALREGRLNLDSRVPFSDWAAGRPPSKLGIPAGSSISVEQAILALVTRSANDVAAAVGERIGGSEERFAQMMTLRARSLGMSRTTFRNASGLPDLEQVTTARDMATLGRRLFQDFPERYHYFGVTQVRMAGQNIRNHNRMLDSYEGVDGIKTGFINASGFNIVTSASRGGQRIVGAVFGGSSWYERDQHMASLLDRSFEQLGVATAARPAPVLVRSVQAAPVSRAQAQQARQPSRNQAQARQAPARQAQARQAAARQPARATTSRNATQAASRTPSRPAAQPARSAAASTRPAAQPVRSAQPSRSAPSQAAASPSRPVPSTTALPPPVPARGTGTIRTAELR